MHGTEWPALCDEAMRQPGEPAVGLVLVQVTGRVLQGAIPGFGPVIPAGGDGLEVAARINLPDAANC